MGKLFECVRNDILLDLRNGILVGITAIVTVICCVNFFGFMPLEKVAGNSLAVSSWITQALIIMGSIFGFLSMAREKTPVQELFQTIGNAACYKRIGKVILIGLISIMITVICGTVCCIGLKWLNVPVIYYKESVKYIILYWTIPFAISALGGEVIADCVKGKVKYAVVICQMLLWGPLVPTVVEPLVDVTTELYKYFAVFSLGTLNVSKPMNILFGYDLQIERIIAGCMMIISFIVFFLAGGWRKKSAIVLKGIGVIVFVLALAVNMIYITGKYDYYVAMDMYEVYVDEPQQDCNNCYEIRSEDITVQSGLNIKIDTVMSICPEVQDQKIDFVLYSGFDISDIKIEGARVKWERKGDMISVMYPFEQENIYQLEVSYCGKPPAHMYIGSHSWILPAYVAWYPVKGDVNSISFQYDLFEPIFYDYEQEQTEYTLTYAGKDAVYCNLADVNGHCWKGNSNGVTLLSSKWVKEKDLGNGVTVIYPVCCKNYDRMIAAYVEELSAFYGVITDQDVTEGNVFNKLFITCDSTYTGHGERIYDFSDHGIVEITRAYLDGDTLCSPNLTVYPLIETVRLGNGRRVMYEEYVFLYKTMYVMYLIKEGELDSGSQIRTLEDIEKLYNGMKGYEEFTGIVARIDQYMTESDSDKIELFLDKFLQLLKSGETITMDKVEIIMEN